MRQAESHVSLFLRSAGFIPRGFANHPTQHGVKIYMYDSPEMNGKRVLVSQNSAVNLAKQLEDKKNENTRRK